MGRVGATVNAATGGQSGSALAVFAILFTGYLYASGRLGAVVAAVRGPSGLSQFGLSKGAATGSDSGGGGDISIPAAPKAPAPPMAPPIKAGVPGMGMAAQMVPIPAAPGKAQKNTYVRAVPGSASCYYAVFMAMQQNGWGTDDATGYALMVCSGG